MLIWNCNTRRAGAGVRTRAREREGRVHGGTTGGVGAAGCGGQGGRGRQERRQGRRFLSEGRAGPRILLNTTYYFTRMVSSFRGFPSLVEGARFRVQS